MEVAIIQSIALGVLITLSIFFLSRRLKATYVNRLQNTSTKVVVMKNYKLLRRKNK